MTIVAIQYWFLTNCISQLSLAIPSWVGTISIGIGHGHARLGKKWYAVGSVSETASVVPLQVMYTGLIG